MAESESSSWGLLPRIIVSAIAAMVLSLALKPYNSRIAPYVKRIKESGIANISFDSATSERHMQSVVPSKKPEAVLDTGKPKDKITEKDKTQLKSVLEKL